MAIREPGDIRRTHESGAAMGTHLVADGKGGWKAAPGDDPKDRVLADRLNTDGTNTQWVENSPTAAPVVGAQTAAPAKQKAVATHGKRHGMRRAQSAQPSHHGGNHDFKHVHTADQGPVDFNTGANAAFYGTTHNEAPGDSVDPNVRELEDMKAGRESDLGVHRIKAAQAGAKTKATPYAAPPPISSDLAGSPAYQAQQAGVKMSGAKLGTRLPAMGMAPPSPFGDM